MIQIELTEQEAAKFRVFMDHYTLFEKLIEAGLHQPQAPQYVLYFNKFNALSGIEMRQQLLK